MRILFMSMVPSLIGPFIGAAVIIDADEFYLDLGVLKQVPTPGIFLAAAITLTIIVIPVIALRRLEDQTNPARPIPNEGRTRLR